MSNTIRKYQKAIKSHTHDDHHQIIIPIEGVLELDVEGKQGLVSGGTIGIVTSGEKHAFRSARENRFIVLDINKLNADTTLNPVWERATNAPFSTLSEALVNLTNYAKYCFDKKADEQLINTWQRLFLQTLSSELDNDLNNLPERMKKVLDHIDLYHGSSLSNADLADVSCLSPSHFHKVFQNTMRISPQSYIKAKRLETAKRLMVKGHSLAQVADEVGFSDQGSFGRAFKSVFELSPGEWRKKELKLKK